MRKAILEGRKVVPVHDFLSWGLWFETHTDRRIVGKSELVDCQVSTVFLGIDHGFDDKPLWFETMIFGGPMDCFQQRYETWEEAEAGHAQAVLMASGASSAKMEMQ